MLENMLQDKKQSKKYVLYFTDFLEDLQAVIFRIIKS